MEQGAINILKKHGCLYMKDDYKNLFNDLENYYNKKKETTKIGEIKGTVKFLRNDSDKCICCEGKHIYSKYIELNKKQTDLFNEIHNIINNAGNSIENKEICFTINKKI